MQLTDLQAQWLEFILNSASPPLRFTIPEEVAGPLLEQELLRRIDPNVIITHAGIEALVRYRMDREKNSNANNGNAVG